MTARLSMDRFPVRILTSFGARAFLLATLVAAVSLGACSRSQPPASPATPPPAAPAPAVQPAADTAPQVLSAELVARLARPHSPVLGPGKARVTVVEVLDPACEACRAFAPVVEQLLFLYPEDVRVVVRFADFHPPSQDAIRLLEAARRQGKFHELLGALFEKQPEWASHNAPDLERAWKIAGQVGVDVARARKEVGTKSVDNMLRDEAQDLSALKVERTPTFFVNGKLLVDFGSDQLFALVKQELGAR
jgi:protein-disulfide isomerase